MEKKRIEFIDLAKGICIIWVIIAHTGVDIPIPILSYARMPLYFILSGLFFKDYGSLKNLTLKKTNKILIPFTFFYLLGYVIFYILKYFFPNLLITASTGVLDVFTNRQYFNGPIWFLLALFWANIYFCIISLLIKNEALRSIAVIAVGVCGVILGRNEVFVPMMMDVAMTALPLFYCGYILKKSGILYPNEKVDKFNIPISMALYTVAFLCVNYIADGRFGFHYNHMVGNVVIAYAVSILLVLSILFLSKTIGRLPVVSYFGRYSIIPLCVHHLIYRPLIYICNLYIPAITDWFVPIVTLLLCLVCIPICKKFLPHVTAQKDIITV